MQLICHWQMFVTDTKENKVLNWYTKLQILAKPYLETLKRLKKTFPKTFLCNRITMTVALEAYLEPRKHLQWNFFV